MKAFTSVPKLMSLSVVMASLSVVQRVAIASAQLRLPDALMTRSARATYPEPVGRFLRAHYRWVIGFGMFVIGLGVVAKLNPLWLLLLRSGRIGSSLIVIGVLTAFVGFVAAIGRMRGSFLSIGFSLVLPALLVSIAGLYDTYASDSNLASATRIKGPGSLELRVRDETRDTDRCSTVELRSGRGVLTKSRDVIACRKSPPAVAFGNDGASVAVTFGFGKPCDYRVDAGRMTLASADGPQCPALPD
jgi:hypothetical protein